MSRKQKQKQVNKLVNQDLLPDMVRPVTISARELVRNSNYSSKYIDSVNTAFQKVLASLDSEVESSVRNRTEEKKRGKPHLAPFSDEY